MEAPEKIYLNPLLMEDGESIVRQCTFERQRDSQVEYTRTDAFIDKAWDWIEDNILSSNQQDKSLLYYERFKNCIKE